MSFLATSIAKVALATLGGVSIVAPTAYALSGGKEKSVVTEMEKEYKFDQIEDFNKCWVVIEGNGPAEDGEDEDGYSNRKVLACPSFSSSEKANFYLWKRVTSNAGELPKEISLTQIKNASSPIQLILTLSTSSGSGNKETVNLSRIEWNSILKQEINLKEKCNVSFERKQITCKGESKRLLYLLGEMNQSFE